MGNFCLSKETDHRFLKSLRTFSQLYSNDQTSTFLSTLYVPSVGDPCLSPESNCRSFLCPWSLSVGTHWLKTVVDLPEPSSKRESGSLFSGRPHYRTEVGTFRDSCLGKPGRNWWLGVLTLDYLATTNSVIPLSNTLSPFDYCVRLWQKIFRPL